MNEPFYYDLSLDFANKATSKAENTATVIPAALAVKPPEKAPKITRKISKIVQKRGQKTDKNGLVFTQKRAKTGHSAGNFACYR